MIAAPERDLWDLDPGDGSIIEAYAAKAAVTVDVNALAYYRLWYDLDEIGGYVAMFQQLHDETADTTESWSNLQHYLRPAERWPEVVD